MMNYIVASKVRSGAYMLSAEAFGAYADAELPLFVFNITEDSFCVAIRDVSGRTPQEFAGIGCYRLGLFVVALNIRTGGLFHWIRPDAHDTQFTAIDLTNGEHIPLVTAKTEIDIEPKSTLKVEMLAGLLELMAFLRDEKDSHLFDEYLRGLHHIGLAVGPVSFAKAAFANFYRNLEFFVARRILKIRNGRLLNELRDFEKAFNIVGLPEGEFDHFRKDTYKLRSSQVMHAQDEQVEISWQDVIDVKFHCDNVMRAYYLSQPPPAYLKEK